MIFEIGVLFALSAFIFWGFGDFLLQKSARKVGDWETLLMIDGTGVIVILPFVYKDFASLLNDYTFFVLIGVSISLLFASIIDFEALKKGKIAVVEPIYALEVPIAALFAFFVINESIEPLQSALITALILGIAFVSLKSHHFSKKAWIERGVALALVGVILMGMSVFLFGFATRVTNPLLAAWFTVLFTGIASFYYLMVNKKLGKLVRDIKSNKKLLLSASILDNLAWVTYGFATSTIPIAIATALSENYIVLATVLGLIINKENLLTHQKAGLVIALSSAIVLAATYG